MNSESSDYIDSLYDELPASVPSDPRAAEDELLVREAVEELTRQRDISMARHQAASIMPHGFDPQGKIARLQAEVRDLYGMVEELTKAVARLEERDTDR